MPPKPRNRKPQANRLFKHMSKFEQIAYTRTSNRIADDILEHRLTSDFDVSGSKKWLDRSTDPKPPVHQPR